jgi:hypothetical protein
MMTLVMLVCGCVVDGELMNGEEQDDRTIVIECPYCGVTFSLKDLAKFSQKNKNMIRGFMIMAVRMTRPLIMYQNEAFEIFEVCGCGYPIVRKLRDRGKPKHLRVPPIDTVQLLD